MGPASTTSGRSVVIGRISLLGSSRCWRVSDSTTSRLLPGDDDQALGVEREGRAVEAAEELDLAPPLRTQHVQELVRRVEPDLAVADQLLRGLLRPGRRALETPPAGAPAAGRWIELVLDTDRRAAPAHALLRRQRAHALVAVPGIDDERAARPERAPEPVDHQPVFVIREVADRAEEVHGQVEFARELHVADVLTHERDRHAGLA